MQGRQRYQQKLFSTVNVEKLIPKSHLLRKVDRVLDLSFVRKLTEELYCHHNGRPSIDPELFMRMLLIGYFYGIESDRRLCEEITFNMAYRWFCKLSLEDDIPDHSSMTRIRDRFGEQVFKEIFKKVVKLCEDKGLIKSGKAIVDASLVKADAALNSLVRHEATEEEIKNRPMFIRGQKYSNKTHQSCSDPDATLACKPGAHKGLYYKVHNVLESKNRVILDTKVTTGAVHDSQPFRSQIEDVLEKGISLNEVTADRAYGSSENLYFLRDKGIRAYIPLTRPEVGQQPPEFKYDKKKDCYRCPEGQKLLRRDKQVGDYIHYSLSYSVCSQCPRMKECLPPYCQKKRLGRYLRRNQNQSLYESVLRRQKTKIFGQKVKERMWKIEGNFAEGKDNHCLRRAHYRGKAKVQIQAYMVSTVQNLKRLIGALEPVFIWIRIDFRFKSVQQQLLFP